MRESIIKRRRSFMLEVLVSIALWASVSPALWHVSFQLYRSVLSGVIDYETHLVARRLAFELHSPGYLKSMGLSWGDFDRLTTLKGKRFSLEGGHSDSWLDLIWEYRAEVTFQRLEQTPKRPSKRYPAWRRLIECHYYIALGADRTFARTGIRQSPQPGAFDRFTLLREVQ